MDHRRRTRLALRLFAVAAAAALTQGCQPKKDTEKPPAAALTEQSVVVRDFSGGLDADFSFGKTIGAILTSAGVTDTPAAREALVKTMLANLTITSANNPVSGLAMPIDNRPNEAGLDAKALLDPADPNGLIPIGLFNRLDLAPADWSDCGEHRIVYATKDGAPKGRVFLIFEAKLPNPGTGMAGCTPVAKQWQAIGAAASNTERKPLLEKLYYAGLDGGFGPVVHHLNYGGFLGQVRANLFAPGGGRKWQLREYRVLPVAAQTLVFSPAPVANNPLVEFYKDTGPAPQAAERARFQTAFKDTYAAALRTFDEQAPATMADADFRAGLLNCMGAPIQLRDDEFQSDAQGAADDPAAQVGPAFKASLADWASADGKRTVSRDDLMGRASVITCGGCHETSGNKQLGVVNGAPIQFPQGQAGGFMFVHISEKVEPSSTRHVMSDTLRTVFVPHRMKVLQSIIDNKDPGAHCAVAAAPAAPAAPAAAVAPPPTRDAARQAAEAVLRPSGGPAAAVSGPPPSQTMRNVSDRAHAADQQKRGAAVAFRRSH